MPVSARKSQFDKALLGLRSLVLNGAFEPNARLSEVMLAERLAISRTPLRQAMDRLVDEGLLERIGTGGCRVAAFTMADILDAIELRGVLEGTAARLAAERGADPAGLAECEATIATLDAAVCRTRGIDFHAYVEQNARLHRLFAGLAGSAVIAREVERASRLPLASPSAFLQGQEFVPDFEVSLRLAQDQHRAILAAIKAREGTRAEALAREHARLARQNLEHVMKGDARLTGRVPGLALVSSD
jgi:GntR family transcriptional regulator of vanillate catabolism